MVSALTLALLMQSLTVQDQDGVFLNCHGADRFWVRVPGNRVTGTYETTAGRHSIRGPSPRPYGLPTSFEEIHDTLPERLLLRWRTVLYGPAELEIADLDAEAGTARYRFRGRRHGQGRRPQPDETSGECSVQREPWPEREHFEPIAVRVDCHVDSAGSAGGVAPAPPASADYVFLFLRREAREGGRGKLLYIVTQDDGRTRIDRGSVTDQSGDRWPDFSADITMSGAVGSLRSVPDRPGRVAFHGLEIMHHSPSLDMEGKCLLIPAGRRAEAVR
jgi:hypothetical protein